MKYPKITQFVLDLQANLNSAAFIATTSSLDKLPRDIQAWMNEPDLLVDLGLIVSDDESEETLRGVLSVPIQDTTDFLVCKFREAAQTPGSSTKSNLTIESLCLRDCAYAHDDQNYAYDVKLTDEDSTIELVLGPDHALTNPAPATRRLAQALSHVLDKTYLVGWEKQPLRLFAAGVSYGDE